MISPHELKDKTFQKAVRGYSIAEVDEYFEFLIDKYTELYRENAELEKKLHVMSAKYDELSNDEKSIREVIVKAQKLSERIIDSAKNEANETIASVSARCDEIISRTKEKVNAEREKIENLAQSAESFREKLYAQYLEHLKLVKAMDIDSELVSDEEIENIAMGVTTSKKDTATESTGNSDIIAPSSEKAENAE